MLSIKSGRFQPKIGKFTNMKCKNCEDNNLECSCKKTEALTSNDLVFAMVAKTPSGEIHQVLISQEKVKQNLHLIIDGDHLQLIETGISGITIDKNPNP